MTTIDPDIINWLKQQPEDATIEWSTDTISEEHPYSQGWVDIYCKDLPQFNWIWTIVTEKEDEDPCEFIYPPDTIIYQIVDINNIIHEIVTPINTPLSYENLMLAYKKTRFGDELHTNIRILGGWSISAISKALNQWVAEHIGRSDIKFKNIIGHSPMAIEAQKALEEIKSGKAETYKLSDNVRASDQVMDTLLQMQSEVSEQLMSKIRRPEKDLRKN